MKKKQLRLERLEGSKFEAFKGNEIQNAFMVFGGEVVTTSFSYCDTYDESSGTNFDNPKDWKEVLCPAPGNLTI